MRTPPRRRRWAAPALLLALAAAAALGFWAWKRERAPAGAEALKEAKALLAQDRAARAERLLEIAVAHDPGRLEPWRLWLELLRAEGRDEEILAVSRRAIAAVSPEDRVGALAEATIALLAQVPERQARETLGRWVEADPGDPRARAAWLRQVGGDPRTGDLSIPDRIAQLEALVAEAPAEVLPRAALAETLLDAGFAEQAEGVLDAWPDSARGVSYDRLRGRWAQDFARDPARAAESYRRIVAAFPQDWRTLGRLARALKGLGEGEEARRLAERVDRLRELLDPVLLGPRLSRAFAAAGDPESLDDLSRLTREAGLDFLADAWRDQARLAEARRRLAPPAKGKSR